MSDAQERGTKLITDALATYPWSYASDRQTIERVVEQDGPSDELIATAQEAERRANHRMGQRTQQAIIDRHCEIALAVMEQLDEGLPHGSVGWDDLHVDGAARDNQIPSVVWMMALRDWEDRKPWQAQSTTGTTVHWWGDNPSHQGPFIVEIVHRENEQGRAPECVALTAFRREEFQSSVQPGEPAGHCMVIWPWPH